MIEVKNLFVSYGKNQVLKDINFFLEKGEIICILGENGSGKSTLLKALLKFIKSTGDVFIDGESLKSFDNKRLSKYISYIPQIHFPSFDYTVTDVVLMGTFSKNDSMFYKVKKSDYELVYEVLNKLNILYLKDKNYRLISGGERQLVLIARAILQASKYIFMDEPVANLDYGNQLKIMTLCSELKKKNMGILITTHNPNHALIYADRVLIVRKDDKSLFGKTNDILTKDNLESLYNIPIEIIDFLGQKILTPNYRKVMEKNVLE